MIEPPRSLLIIKPGSMGDVIHALPVASAIHRAWPTTKITWIVDPRWSDLLKGNPAIASIHEFPRQQFQGIVGKIRAVRWFSELPQLKADLVLDLQGLLRSALMAKCSRTKNIHGLSDAREGASWFYTTMSEVGKNEHAVNRYLKCLPSLGISIPTIPEFTIPMKGLSKNTLLNTPYVVLHPFARGENKSLTAEAITKITTNIAHVTGKKVVLVGKGGIPAGLSDSVVNLVGQTSLDELISIMHRAQFVISVDSGPMHLAAALGVPLLGIHTWSDPRLVGPYNENAWIWQGGEIRQQNFKHAPLPEQIFSIKDAEDVAKFVAARIS